jgi:hypothetical protein
MTPDYIAPEIALPIAAILWAIVITRWVRGSRKYRK